MKFKWVASAVMFSTFALLTLTAGCKVVFPESASGNEQLMTVPLVVDGK
ncbi:hypothetical protein [Tumebacillus flagellatus]|nr:hypothetical protein [Tumebacillus flagellatus]